MVRVPESGLGARRPPATPLPAPAVPATTGREPRAVACGDSRGGGCELKRDSPERGSRRQRRSGRVRRQGRGWRYDRRHECRTARIPACRRPRGSGIGVEPAVAGGASDGGGLDDRESRARRRDDRGRAPTVESQVRRPEDRVRTCAARHPHRCPGWPRRPGDHGHRPAHHAGLVRVGVLSHGGPQSRHLPGHVSFDGGQRRRADRNAHQRCGGRRTSARSRR